MIKREEKKKLISDYKINTKDTGSSSVQIAIMTKRINELISHFKANTKDFDSRRGLLKLVGRRRRLLSYLKTSNTPLYKNLLSKLDLRK